MMTAQVCCMCEALTAQWVLWANWRGDLRHFCDDDCLRRWLERCLDEVYVDVMHACRADAAEE
jgi:hypothetical protein